MATEVSYEDFAKLDIRVARVKEAEPVGEKLYKLLLDVGGEERVVLAGLRKFYSEDELIGKLVVMIFNLKPRKLMGIESQGMLLAADDGERVALLTPDKEVNEGAKVM